MRTLAEQRPLRADGERSKYEHPPLLVAPWQAAMPGGAHINAAAMKETESDVDEEYEEEEAGGKEEAEAGGDGGGGRPQAADWLQRQAGALVG